MLLHRVLQLMTAHYRDHENHLRPQQTPSSLRLSVRREDCCFSGMRFLACLILVICTRNRVPGPGPKIHYPNPNLGKWYPFLHWLLMKPMKISLLAAFVAKFSTAREIRLQPFSLTDYAPWYHRHIIHVLYKRPNLVVVFPSLALK